MEKKLDGNTDGICGNVSFTGLLMFALYFLIIF